MADFVYKSFQEELARKLREQLAGGPTPPPHYNFSMQEDDMNGILSYYTVLDSGFMPLYGTQGLIKPDNLTKLANELTGYHVTGRTTDELMDTLLRNGYGTTEKRWNEYRHLTNSVNKHGIGYVFLCKGRNWFVFNEPLVRAGTLYNEAEWLSVEEYLRMGGRIIVGETKVFVDFNNGTQQVFPISPNITAQEGFESIVEMASSGYYTYNGELPVLVTMKRGAYIVQETVVEPPVIETKKRRK